MTISRITESAVIPAWRVVFYLAAFVVLSSCVSAALAQTEEQVPAEPNPEISVPPGEGEPDPYSPTVEVLGVEVIRPTLEDALPVPWTRQLVASWLAMPFWLQEILGIPIIAGLLAGVIIIIGRPLTWTVSILTRERTRSPKPEPTRSRKRGRHRRSK